MAMMGILPDNDIPGQFALLTGIWQSHAWQDIWAGLALKVCRFEDLGLQLDAADCEIWRRCQASAVVLFTGNRNDEGQDSLESTIRNEITAASLPVFTLADPKRVARDKRYARKVAEKALEYLLYIEDHLGAGRIYLP
jgi:hypothetical protein